MKKLWSWIIESKNVAGLSLVLGALPILAACVTYVSTTLFPEPDYVLVVKAEDFALSQEVSMGIPQGCSEEFLFNAPPYEAKGNMAEYLVSLKRGGKYRMYLEHATHEVRDVFIQHDGGERIKGQLLKPSIDKCKTRTDFAVNIDMERGLNVVRLSSDPYFPHIKSLQFVRYY